MPGSNDPIGMLRIISTWLHDQIMSEVSPFVFWCLADVCRCKLDGITLMPGYVDP